MRRSVLFGSLLALLGLGTFIISALPVRRVDEVINTSFALSPGGKYGPYDNGTYYHTRVFITKFFMYKSTLEGEASVQGEGIYLTVNGHNTQGLQSVYVDERESFVIDPADDQYTFTFDNTKNKFTARFCYNYLSSIA